MTHIMSELLLACSVFCYMHGLRYVELKYTNSLIYLMNVFFVLQNLRFSGLGLGGQGTEAPDLQ
jgi:hypothetical protein